MKSEAKNIDDYLAQIPERRLPALKKLRDLCLEYLPDYQESLAVNDKNIITANGIAPIEFAREVFMMINLFDDKNLEKWFQLFKNGIWEK